MINYFGHGGLTASMAANPENAIMNKVFLFSALCILMLASCSGKKVEPAEPAPEKPVFQLDSYNGAFVQALSDAYETFEETGSLPPTVHVEGILYSKGKYILAACLLLEKITSTPEAWQEEDVNPISVAFGDEYRWNTFDPDVIDFNHVRFMARQLLDYTQAHPSLPDYVAFPSDDPANPGYLPKLVMVTTEHENRMNLRTCAVVLTRVFNHFVENEGIWPDEVSSWPASYLDAAQNCPIDDPVVLTALQDALKNLKEDASDLQKAEAIFSYSRDEWEWEDYFNTRKGAVATIQSKSGNCCDLSHATISLCRAAGIPARYLHGQCYFSSGIIGHVIPEIYVDGRWWICDPSNNNATFGTPVWRGMDTFNGRYNQLEF